MMTSLGNVVKPTSYAWPSGSGQLVIEQQCKANGNPAVDGFFYGYGLDTSVPPVINPFRDRLWDIDDLWNNSATGSMQAGETYAFDVPIVLDNQLRQFSISGTGGKGRKHFRLRFSIAEIGFEVVRDYLSGANICFFGPSFNFLVDSVSGKMVFTSPLIQPIPNSQGGQGVMATAHYEIIAVDNLKSAGLSGAVIYPSLQGQAQCSGEIVTIPA